MPYNTRRKSLSLPSLGIHIPVTHVARAAAAAAAAAASKASARPAPTPTSRPTTEAQSTTPESHPNKRLKRSHGTPAPLDPAAEQTPPPSPTPASVGKLSDAHKLADIDFEAIHDDIVEASISQLLSTANRPHLIKELATVLSQKLVSVQQSANPCAIISSRLTSFMKRLCWSSSKICPLAKELEPVHPRRTYFFLTTCTRQPIPRPNVVPQVARPVVVTPSVSLTDDSGSDDVDARRRDLSPSPELDLSRDFDDPDGDIAISLTPIGSFNPLHQNSSGDMRHDSPPLEKDEREFSQTADVLQKRKHEVESLVDVGERNPAAEYVFRDDIWFGDCRAPTSVVFTSPAMKPAVLCNMRKEDAEAWMKMFEWDKGAESIEIDELDCLLDEC